MIDLRLISQYVMRAPLTFMTCVAGTPACVEVIPGSRFPSLYTRNSRLHTDVRPRPGRLDPGKHRPDLRSGRKPKSRYFWLVTAGGGGRPPCRELPNARGVVRSVPRVHVLRCIHTTRWCAVLPSNCAVLLQRTSSPRNHLMVTPTRRGKQLAVLG